MLVLQPASGLHFPAVEALRKAILTRALEGTWARMRWAAVIPSSCRCFHPPGCCRRTPRPRPQLLGPGGWASQSGVWWVLAVCMQQGGLFSVAVPKDPSRSLFSGALVFRGEKGPVCSLKEIAVVSRRLSPGVLLTLPSPPTGGWSS